MVGNVEHLFTCLLAVFFGEGSVWVFCPFSDWVVFLVLGCMTCLCVLEMEPLLVASFVSVFSHSKGCLFILFVVSLAVQELVSLTGFHLFVFAFVSIALGD